jgi:molybdate transport system regulatory protein
MSKKTKFHYTYRLYFNLNGRRVLGKAGAQILEAVNEYGSIAEAAKSLDMSHKFVWNYLTRMRSILKQPMIVTHRGGTEHGKGKRGGGGASITPLTISLLKEFRRTERRVHALPSNASTPRLPNAAGVPKHS